MSPVGHFPTDSRKARIAWAVLAIAAVLFIVQALLASGRKSASFDEQYHLAAGYSYLRTGDFRLATTHPPLLGMVAALGLLPMDGITLPLEHPSWETGDRFAFSDVFLWESNERSVLMVEAARVPLIALGVLLLLIMYIWTRQMLGMSAAMLATILVAFEPNLVSNARVVGTDFGLTVLLFCAMWRTWRWLESPTWQNALWMGVFAGLSMAAKYTGLVYWPVAVAASLLYPVAGADRGYSRRLRGLMLAAVVAYATVWAVYSFDTTWVHLGTLSYPLPAGFFWRQLWTTFQSIAVEDEPKMGFLLGETFANGPLLYFPVALAVKTPIALLLLLGVGSYVMAAQRRLRQFAVIWLPAVAFLALGLTGLLAIGFRHMLPAMPYVVMLAANATNLQSRAGARQRVYRYALAVAVLWLILSSLRVYPHQEAYFNEFAGRWQNWSRILVDSNLDWGQDLPSLRAKMAELGISKLNLAYFGKSVPEKYGVQYDPLPGYLRFMDGYEVRAYNPYTPEPGWYAISATSLRLGTLLQGTTDLYTEFAGRDPDARAGYSIYLYHLDYPQNTEIERAVVVGDPVSSWSAEQLGVEAGARVQAKWTRSDDSAIYAVGEEAPDAGELLPGAVGNFGDVFALEGYTLAEGAARPGDNLHVQLFWRKGEADMVTPAPTRARPLSAFVQLVDKDTRQVVAGFDGWDTALRGLEPGDIVVQNVELSLPEDLPTGEYLLTAGLYSAQNGQRLHTVAPGNGADAVDLKLVDVS